MFQHRKWTAVMRLSLVMLFLSIYSELGFSRCVYETTAKPSDGYLGCWGRCNLDVHHDDSDGTNPLSCSTLHLSNYCRRYCADANQQMCPSTTSVGNPINIADGSKTHHEIDFQTGGLFPLKIERFYNSAVKMPDGNFGKKWQASGNAKIISTRIPSTGAETYTVQRLGGDYIAFTWDGVANDGRTIPVKTGVDVNLWLYNYGVNGIPQVMVLTYKSGDVEVYDLNLSILESANRYESKLMWRENPVGQRHRYTYNSNGDIKTASDNFGNQLQYTYYFGSSRIETVTVMPGERVFRYAYDAVGNLQYVYYPDGNTDPGDNPFKTYHYENAQYPHHLTGISDENGQRYATYGYNNDGLARLSEHAGGAERIEVLSYGDTTRVLNANGRETQYIFNTTTSQLYPERTTRRLTQVNGEATLSCLASNTSVSYDSNGFKDKSIDGRGYVTDFTYNTSGQQTSRTEALQNVGGTLTPTEATRTIETDWYPSGLVKEIREPGKTTQYTYYSNNQIHTKTEIDTTTHITPYSTAGTTRTWIYSYTYHDPGTQILIATQAVDGPRTDVPDIQIRSFNNQGFLTQVVRRVSNSLALTTQITDHTPEGLPLQLVDENGVTTTLTYTPRKWLETRTVATSKGNAVTRYFYDNAGQVTKIRLPNGVEVNYDYDDAHRLEATYTNDNERLEYELDALGNKKIERALTSGGEIRKLQQREFDDLGRLWKVIGVENQEVLKQDYDENDNLVGITDYNQRTLVQAFDGLNRLKSITDRKNGLAEYSYNGQDKLVKVKDQNGLETIYVVDGFGRRIQQASPDTGVTVYRFDLADNMIEMKDARNVVTTYTYDGLNRMTSASFPANPSENITYRYDETSTSGTQNYGRGQMTGITEANGNRVDWIFDQLGQIARDIRVVGNQTYTTRYDRDLAGLLTTITYPGGREVNYQFDSNGRISTLRTRKTSSAAWVNLASTIQYEPFGPVKSFAYGNGMTQSNVYDLHYRPASLQALNGTTPVQGLEYGFNLNNELESITSLVQAARNQMFLYDANNQLEQAIGSYGVFDFEYDGIGNRLSLDSNTFSETYSYPIDSHRLGSVTSTGSGGQNRSFAYSNAGNMTSNGTFTFDYNHRNRLVGVRQGETTVAGYGLNALGQRISKTVNGATTHFHYGLDNKLLAESTDAGVIKRNYVYLNDQVIAIVDAK